ncbi:uncharacterized protein LTR77_002610 [Saxophila tyrrhenica]|uniref:BD-FAE-like domain-containing protein n=1 Tax=Saxophila tyrrhenica TaxID=1690608 RepID=A0AAV9PJQ1_9PEZI|nr:hypothetical protein LTR77_002610 [Saxophila tyrrhenica]
MTGMLPSRTLTYKTVGSLDILLDIYLAPKVTKAPILLWLHGGGLLQGHRSQLPPYLRRGVQQQGYTCVSADYRLAPQTTLPDIFRDVKDCISFIRSSLPARLAEAGLKNVVDVSRLAVSGSSAGGYLALLAGLYIQPKPQVVVATYPMTDPLGPAFAMPQPPPTGYSVPSAKAMAPYLDRSAEVVANCEPPDPRMDLPLYMLSTGRAPELLGVQDPEVAKPWRVSRKIHEHRLPPTYVLHADTDSAVGVEQADEVVGAAVGCGLEVVYERVHGKEHLFDMAPEYENEDMMGFVMKHLT